MTNTKPTPRVLHVCVPVINDGQWTFCDMLLDLVHHDHALTGGTRLGKMFNDANIPIPMTVLYATRPFAMHMLVHGPGVMKRIPSQQDHESRIGALYTFLYDNADWNARGEAVVFVFLPHPSHVLPANYDEMTAHGTALLARGAVASVPTLVPVPAELCLPTRDLTATELVKLGCFWDLQRTRYTRRMAEAIEAAFNGSGIHSDPVTEDMAMKYLRVDNVVLLLALPRVKALKALGFRVDEVPTVLFGGNIEPVVPANVCTEAHGYYKVTSPAFL